MSIRKQSFAPGEFYHLYNRGTEKRIIFLDKHDYSHFLFLAYICNTVKNFELRNIGEDFDREETIVDIGAYCLMPNHFHLLIHEKTENGISKYVHKLLTAYSMYFNKKYERTGKLYEGKFKSIHVGRDQYFKYLYSYIHLNPAKIIDKNWRGRIKYDNKLFQFILAYKYSSLNEYLSGKFKILSPSEFPAYFRRPNDHKKELLKWLSFNDDDNS